MTDIPFDRRPPGEPGKVESVAPGVRRLVAPNPGPFTFTGTCTYIIGQGRVAILDPGPEDPFHVTALLDAVKGETVEAVLITHTHRDHSPAARAVVDATGARTYGEGSHRSARPLRLGELNPLDASADHAFVPDVMLKDGDTIAFGDVSLRALATPGHCANHLAFALADGTVFSGDHVMAWSTSIVAPPDGAMGDYMASLDKMQARDDRIYWPGHGPAVTEPKRFVRAMIHHRRMREAAVLRATSGGAGLREIVARVYAGLDDTLMGAAALNALAHLEDLVERGLVEQQGDDVLMAAWAAA